MSSTVLGKRPRSPSVAAAAATAAATAAANVTAAQSAAKRRKVNTTVAAAAVAATAADDDGIFTKEQRIKTFLRKAAVGDAAHDFSGTRSSVLFNSIFSEFKDIGAPKFGNELSTESPHSEYDILNDILKFQTLPPKSMVDAFRETILKEDSSKQFYRWKEDTIPYEIKAKLVALRPKGGGNYDWKVTPEEMFNFMKGNKPELVFTVDATNVPFSDLFTVKNPISSAADTILSGKYLSTREGINDAATKLYIPDIIGNKIRIQTLEDKANFNVLYPVFTNDKINELSELECFYSNYNLTMSPVSDGKIPSATLSICDKQLIRQVQVMKSNKEDAHPNAVPTLSKRIFELAKFLTPVGNMNKKMEYYAALQQKRSGDWLQVLACLQPERFGLPSSTRVTLVTLDKICVAYALFMGIDVMMTYYYKTPDGQLDEYWMIQIYKKLDATPLTKEQILNQAIQSYHKPTVLSQIIAGDAEPKSYKEYKQLYIDNWNTQNTGLLNSLNAKIQEFHQYIDALNSEIIFGTKRYTGQIETKCISDIKTILNLATTLSVFRSLAPQLLNPGLDESNIFTNTATSSNYSTMLESFELFKKNFMILYTAITSKKAKSTSATQAIQTYFISIFNKNGEGTLAQKTRASFIEDLQIMGKIFGTDKNRAGIFSFLQSHLTSEESNLLKTAIHKYSLIQPDATKGKYKAFLEASFLLLGEFTIVVDSIPANELIQSIEMIHPVKENEIPDDVSSVGKDSSPVDLFQIVESAQLETIDISIPPIANNDGLVQVNNNFQITDFGAALSVLSSQFGFINSEAGFQVHTEILNAFQRLVGPQNPIELQQAQIYADVYGTGLSNAIHRGLSEEIAKQFAERYAYYILTEGKSQEEAIIMANQAIGVVGGGSKSRSRKISKKSKIINSVLTSFIHNPYVTFYLILRELSFRLSQVSEQHNYHAYELFSAMICNIIKSNEKVLNRMYTTFPQLVSSQYRKIYESIYEYLYFSSIEFALLGQTITIPFIDPSLLNDIILNISTGYYGEKEIRKSKERSILSLDEIQGLFTVTSSKKNQLLYNLEIMKSIIPVTRKLDEGMSNYKKKLERLRTKKFVSTSLRKTIKLVRSKNTTMDPLRIQSSRRSSKSSQRLPSRRSSKSSQRLPSRRSSKSSQRQASRQSLKNIPKKEREYKIQVIQNSDPNQRQVTPRNKQIQNLQFVNSGNPIEIY